MAGAEAARAALAERDPHTMPGNLPAPVSGAVSAFGPVDQARILQLLGLDPRSPISHAVVAVCERYNLDPLLGHVIILPKSNKPYVTIDGYRHVALSHPDYDGMVITDGPRRDGAEREWVCRVAVHRKSMGHPFEMPGRAGLEKENGWDMALARAKRRALREAFDIAPGPVFAEDEWEDTGGMTAQVVSPAAQGPAGTLPPEATPAGKLTAEQRGEIQALFKSIGVTGSAARATVLRDWGYPSTAQLDAAQAEEVIGKLQARLDDQNAEAAEASGQEGNEGGDGASDFPGAPPPPEPPEPAVTGITREQRIEINRRLEAAGITERGAAMDLISRWAGRVIHSTGELEGDEIDAVLRHAAQLGEADAGDD